MTKCTIISSYNKGQLAPFGESLGAMLKEAFEDLHFKTTHSYNMKYINSKPEDIVLFVMPPEIYLDKWADHPVGDGERIYWNLEYVNFKAPTDGEKDKYHERVDLIESMFAERVHNLDAVWFYDVNQYMYYSHHPEARHVKTGVSRCMIPTSTKINPKDRTIIFTGSPNGPVGEFCKDVHKDVGKKRFGRIKFLFENHRNFVDNNQSRDFVGSFRLGISIADTHLTEFVKWHRIMSYAAARVLIVSDVKLEKYGLVEGTHYRHFDNIGRFVNIVEQYLVHTSEPLLNVIPTFMYDKVFEDYTMKDILEEALYE